MRPSVKAHKAWLDQEMARLFDSCDWTQEAIAERVSRVTGKRVSQQYVCYRLIFGRFLIFTTTGCKTGSWLSTLTERRFREQWQQTKGNERSRFEQVAQIFETGIAHGKQSRVVPPGIAQASVELVNGRRPGLFPYLPGRPSYSGEAILPARQPAASPRTQAGDREGVGRQTRPGDNRG